MSVSITFASAPSGAEALAVGLRPGLVPCATAAAGERGRLLARALAGKHRFKGEEGDVRPVLTPEGWLVAVGLDEAGEQDAAALRRIGAALFAELADSGITHLDAALDLAADEAAELAYGLVLRAWKVSPRYRLHPDPESDWSLAGITVVSPDPEASRRHFARLEAVAAAVAEARDLVVAPANELTPQAFADRLAGLFPLGVAVEILDAQALAKQGLNLLLAVGRGSARPPLLACLRWTGADDKEAAPLAFVGKGITFDTGGLCLKEGEDMAEMKGDMGGAAAVMGLMAALARRRAKVNAVGVLAIAENMVSGKAQRPGDVVRAYNGTMVEVVDTDAEGRLVLADALAWTARSCRPAALIDLATLTGAVETALGKKRAGLFCNDDALAEQLAAAGEAEEELLWRLPLTDLYDEDLKSAAADLRSCSWEDRAPDHLHAARFLQHFVPEGLPWAHLDIAGTAEAGEDEDGDEPFTGPGPTGFGIRLLDGWIAAHHEE
ncbi:cytosol aminopeptidase [mine drainage metagenome]|uniref:Cytosol aminopeptidase n=1 Tax=mine drainage metagenome TaxID=410659 RepID=A0A1J5RRB3_9ZZZZ